MRRFFGTLALGMGLLLGLGRGRGPFPVVEVYPLPQTPEVVEPFRDTAFGEKWYDGAQYGYRRGMVRGVTETRFGGEERATRAMAVAMLWRLAGKPEPMGESGFTDVEEGWYYAPAVAWAEKAGLVRGFGDGTFQPQEGLTRGQLATLLDRWAPQGDRRAFQTTREGMEEEVLCRGELVEALMEAGETFPKKK